MWNILPLYNSDALATLFRSAGGFSVQNDTPVGIREFRDAFSTSSLDFRYVGIFLGAILFIILVFTIWREVKKFQERKNQITNNPDLLFKQLLNATGLTTNEQKLLNEMTSQTRLKHPAMCLLSPGMLNWSKQLWLKEKGRRIVTAGKIAQIKEISIKLYDHQP